MRYVSAQHEHTIGSILSSNYWHIVYIILVVNFDGLWQTSYDMWCNATGMWCNASLVYKQKWTPAILLAIVHGTVSTVLGSLNCCTYCVCSGFTLVGSLCLVAICLFVCSHHLVVIDYCYYHCLSNSQLWPCTKVEGADSLPLGWTIVRDGWLFQA